MSLSVVLVDDHTMLRQGLRRALEAEGIVVVGEASDGFEAVKVALADPEVVKRIEGAGADVESSTPEELASLVRRDLAKWRQVVQTAKLQAD